MLAWDTDEETHHPRDPVNRPQWVWSTNMYK